MNLHQLAIFRAVVDAGSFSKAAEELGMAQSAVSYHIKALEQVVGSPLFSRVRTRIHLTQKGHRLHEHTEKIFDAVAEAERDLCESVPSAGLHLQFGLGVSSLSDQLPDYVKHLRQIRPGARVQLTMGSTPQIIDLLRARTLDLGIVSLPVNEPDIDTTSLFYEEDVMVVVTGRNSPLGDAAEILPAMLNGLPLILYNRTTATRASLDQFFRDAGITPTVLMEVDREDAIIGLVRSGLGATILPRCFFHTQPPDGGLRFLPLRDAYLRRQVGVACMRRASRPGLVDLAIRLCHEHFQGAEPRACSAD